MVKNFILILLFALCGSLLTATPLKVDPGAAATATFQTTFDNASLPAMPAMSAESTYQAAVLFTTGATLIGLAFYPVVRRKAKSKHLRMRGAGVFSKRMLLLNTSLNRLTAYRTKSPLLRTRGSSELSMTA